jgi:predicted CoA-substrate-specific enzyme activase
MGMAWFLGIDIGSGTSKGVIATDGEPEFHHILGSGVNYGETARKLREELLARAGLRAEDIAVTVTTGHGAGRVPFDSKQVPDIQCCARGIHHIFPSVRTVIDVQGQSTQVIQVDEKGQVTNFAASEACASASGCFIDVIANVLQIELKDIGPLSLKSKTPVTFATGCAVFGESEAISRVSEGVLVEDILAGVHKALAIKISALVERVGLQEPCAITGGGGLNIGLINKLEDAGIELLIPPQPQFVNAIGASIMAEEIV